MFNDIADPVDSSLTLMVSYIINSFVSYEWQINFSKRVLWNIYIVHAFIFFYFRRFCNILKTRW